jgi:hypothetical protein
MSEATFHHLLLLGVLGLAPLVLAFTWLVPVPYGRYARPWWSGPALPSRVAWLVMELPQLGGMLLWFALGERRTAPVALALLGLWCFHYVYRVFIYPFLPRASTMTLSVVLSGVVLNSAFSYLNGRWLFTLGPARDVDWLVDPRFLLGVLLFAGGWLLATASDAHLRSLRRPGERDYRIPTFGLYRFITSPNYLGELLMWTGWTVATWSLAGLAILVISAANLVPRARANLRWYREKFPAFAASRKALVPFLF